MSLPFPEVVDLALADLDAVDKRLPTFFDECWVPAAPNHDRPTRQLPPNVDPDHVPGPVWDCGLADHRAREGWKQMIQHLTAAAVTANETLCATLDVQPRPVPPCRPAALTDAQFTVRLLRERYKAIHALWGQWSADSDPRVRWLEDALMKGPGGREDGSCCDDVKQAMHAAQRVVRQVGTGKAPATCTQCRRLGSIGQPRIGGACFACDKRNQRAGLPRRTTVVVKLRRATLKAKRRDVA